ncbi:MAG: class I SAM-dependent methyltransferase [Acidobacteriota bacterium]
MHFAVPHAAKEMYQRAAWTLAFTAVFYYINAKEYPGPAFQVSAILVLLSAGFVAAGYGYTWLANVGQTRIREQILDGAALTGSERVLDFGCGTGELAIEAGKRLKSGKVIAVGETATNEAAREVAKGQGLQDKVRFEAGELTKLTYPDANFDVVLSSRSLEGLTVEDGGRALREIARVLKPGGRLALQIVGDAGHYVSELQTLPFERVTASPTSMPLGLGGRVVLAQKRVS